jgi:hypothetical protein
MIKAGWEHMWFPIVAKGEHDGLRRRMPHEAGPHRAHGIRDIRERRASLLVHIQSEYVSRLALSFVILKDAGGGLCAAPSVCYAMFDYRPIELSGCCAGHRSKQVLVVTWSCYLTN